jgi:hypothetical protein
VHVDRFAVTGSIHSGHTGPGLDELELERGVGRMDQRSMAVARATDEG